MGAGRMATGGWILQYGSSGDKFQALGKSDAALMGGALLAMDGLRRGGKAGVAETTAGGALIGYKFGGPLGAAIGGIAGAVAGIVRLFVKGAADKAKEKIKALYGVDIADKGMLKQIVDMAKSDFGGGRRSASRPPPWSRCGISSTRGTGPPNRSTFKTRTTRTRSSHTIRPARPPLAGTPSGSTATGSSRSGWAGRRLVLSWSKSPEHPTGAGLRDFA